MQRKEHIQTVKQQLATIWELKRKGVGTPSLAKRYQVTYDFMQDLLAATRPAELERRQQAWENQ